MTLSTTHLIQGAMMKTGTFRLKGSSLLARAENNGVENRHQLGMQANVSHQTIYSIFNGQPIKLIDLRVLSRILILGVGYTPEELMNTKFGDIFEYVTEGEYGAAD